MEQEDISWFPIYRTYNTLIKNASVLIQSYAAYLLISHALL